MKALRWCLLAFVSGNLGAATIYECRAYNGATFYSKTSCSQQNAAGVLQHSVPDSLDFDQQVKLITDMKAKNQKVADGQSEERVRLGECSGIDDELKSLRQKYLSWQHVPVVEVNADQQRERDLKARYSQLQCHSP